MSNNATRANQLIQEALAHHGQGRLGKAENALKKALKLQPGHPDAMHLLGVMMHQKGNSKGALIWVKRAVAAAPNVAGYQNNLGDILRTLGDLDGARKAFQTVREISRDPALNAMAIHNLGLIEAAAENWDAAFEFFKGSLALMPGNPEAYAEMGDIERRRGRLEAAVTQYQEALRLEPRQAAVASNLGLVMQALGKFDEAEKFLSGAIAIDPASPELHMNLAGLLLVQDRAPEALPIIQRCLALAPKWLEAEIALGAIYQQIGDTERARTTYQACSARNRDSLTAAWGAELTLPILHEDEDSIERSRQAWEAGIDRIAERLKLDTPAQIDEAFFCASGRTNFLLHYQGRIDRPLQEKWGALIHRICRAKYPSHTELLAARADRVGRRVRVGILSSFWRDHSIYKTHGRWAMNLDRDQCEVFAIHTGGKEDHATAVLKSRVEHYVHHPRLDGDLLDRLQALRLDVLIFADIGMDPICNVLAAMRFAPVQCNGLGHPITSGLPTIDWALTSDLQEKEGAETQYSEKLFRLAHLAVSYPSDHIAAAMPDGRSPNPDAPFTFSCPQSLYKLLPDQDRLFAAIAKQVDRCRFRFIEHRSDHVTQAFRRRLAQAFDAEGLNADDYCEILGRLAYSDFLGNAMESDLVLDSLHWSGNNSSLETVFCGTPILTCPGDTFRSRHTHGTLRRLDMDGDLSRDSADSYVQTAVALAKDRGRLRELRQTLLERRERVFDDPAPIQDLQRFIMDAATET